MDNFFTSIPLAKTLYGLQTFITGTIRRNRKYLPVAFENKFGVGEKKYYRKNSILAWTMREKKSQLGPVYLCQQTARLKTEKLQLPGDIEREKRKKPSTIHDYNSYMGVLTHQTSCYIPTSMREEQLGTGKKSASIFFHASS